MSKRKSLQNNKVLWALLGLLLVCFLVLGFGFYKYFYAGAGNNKYGDRLDGIEKYPLSKTLDSDVKSVFSDNSEVTKTKVDVKGKVIYINIDFGKSIKVSEAQDIAVKALDKIGEENLKYYDVQFILTYSGTDENSNFLVFGSKSSSSLKVVW